MIWREPHILPLTLELGSESLYIWSILENAPCALEKNMYAIVVRWSVLYMSIRSSWFVVLSPLFTYLPSIWFYPLLRVGY